MVGHGLPVKLREQTEDPRVRRDDLVKMTLAKDGLAMKQFERKCFVISSERLGLSSRPDYVDADDFPKSPAFPCAKRNQESESECNGVG